MHIPWNMHTVSALSCLVVVSFLLSPMFFMVTSLALDNGCLMPARQPFGKRQLNHSGALSIEMHFVGSLPNRLQAVIGTNYGRSNSVSVVFPSQETNVILGFVFTRCRTFALVFTVAWNKNESGHLICGIRMLRCGISIIFVELSYFINVDGDNKSCCYAALLNLN